MQKKVFSIGIDIGGTNTSLGLVDLKGDIVSEVNLKTKDYQNPEEYVKAIKDILLPIIEKHRKENILGIGIGAPNANYYTGNIEFAVNLPWKGVIPFRQMIKDAMKMPAIITNDANAAAIGELVYGAAQGIQNFIMVTLGTGVGSGFIANGEVIYGDDGFAGEIGHVIAIRDGRPCSCGRRGCLETYASATGIVTTAMEFLQQADKNTDEDVPSEFLLSFWRAKHQITSKEIFIAAEAQDPLALEIFEFTGKILGETLANTVAITSPKMIVLFGGLSLAGDYILLPTKKHMEENLLSIFQNKVSIVLSELNNKNAAILGAASLIFKEHKVPQ